jgi:hypothetical protein
MKIRVRPADRLNQRSIEMKRSVSIAVVALVCLPGGAWAEAPQDSFWAELSYFYPTITSTARLDFVPTARPGSSIRLEDELDLEDRKGTPYLTLGMRLGDNWRLEFEYYELNRSASSTIERQIDWGDVSFDVGAQLNSTFDTTVYRLTAGYSFYKSDVAEAGVGFGFHVTEFSTSISGQGIGPAGLGFQSEGRDTLVPLPTLGLYGSYKILDQLQLRGRVDYLTLKYDEYDGSLLNWLAAIDWRFAKNWGAGIGYRYVDYTLEATKHNFYGEINYKFKGPTIYLNAGF